MHIVCGTDFTPNGNDAASVAAAWATRLSDSLQLTHIVEKPPVKSIDETLWQGFLAPFIKELDGQARRFREEGAEVHTHLKIGGVADELILASQKPNTRLMVVSSVGRIAVSRLLVGSVAERVAEQAAVPTLVVRRPAPLMGWAGGRKPLKVVVAVDFTASSEGALRWIRDLGELPDWEITLAYVGWMANEKRRFGMPTQPASGHDLSGVEEALTRDVSELGRRILGHDQFETRVVVTWGNAAVRTIELGEELGADLLVSGTHQVHGVRRLWHSSFSRTLLHDSPTNILLVPALGASLTAADSIEYHRVLVSTDLSELGNRAIPAALAAVDPGGTLQIVHVIPPGPVTNPLDDDSVEMGKVLKRKHDDEKRRLETALRSLVPVTPQSASVTVEIELVESATPPEAIVQAAERFGAQMVCLASHGKSGIAKSLLGSVSGEVLRRSHRPVLVVRIPEP